MQNENNNEWTLKTLGHKEKRKGSLRYQYHKGLSSSSWGDIRWYIILWDLRASDKDPSRFKNQITLDIRWN